MPLALVAVVSLAAVAGSAVLDGPARLAAVGVALALVGLGWGSLRMDALRRSVLVASVGESGVAELVTVAPARSSPYAIRVLAWHGRSGASRVSERVLLVLPVGRSPPRGAVIEATVRVAEPRPEQDGFDERAWLARQGVHVVLEASSWRQIGRRGGIAGFGDALRDRIERAVGRGTDGVRRGIVLGVVLGEDEGLPRGVQDDFRASGLYHLLAVSGQNVAFLAARDLRPRLARAATEDVARALDPRRDRRLRPRGRLAAVGRARGRRGGVGVARLARRQTARPVALPGGRGARAHGVDADVGARAGLPALVRRGRRDLPRRPARADIARRLSAARGRRRCARRRTCVRSHDRTDRPAALRQRTALHGAGERARVRGGAARARPRAPRRRGRSGLADRCSRSRCARGLGGSLARAGRPSRRRSSRRADRRARPHSRSAALAAAGWFVARAARRRVHIPRQRLGIVALVSGAAVARRAGVGLDPAGARRGTRRQVSA